MPVPLLDLNAQNLMLETELKVAFERVLRHGQFILGKEVTQFEEAIAKFTGTKHAIGVSSGTDAILLALMAAKIGPGDEVLCPSYTFFATAGCVARAGAKPVFVDADPIAFNLDVADAARRITPRTKAIIPVHLFGQAAAMDEVMLLARQPIPVYGDGLHVRDWLYVTDHAQALWQALRHGRAGETYCLSGGNEWPNLRLVEHLCDLVDELAPQLGGNTRRLITFVRDRPGHDRRYATDSKKAERELGWQPAQPFEPSLQETVRWYLERGVVSLN